LANSVITSMSFDVQEPSSLAIPFNDFQDMPSRSST
jgi:hypothetical protein